METDTDRDEIDQILAEVDRLIAGIEVPRDEGFAERLASSVAGPVTSEVAARALIQARTNALKLLKLRLFTHEELDQHFIQALQASFGQSLVQPEASQIAAPLVEATGDALEGCSVDALIELLQQAKPLLTENQACLVDLRIADALRVEGEEVVAPTSREQLIGLRDSAEATAAIALWIRFFEADGRQVFGLVRRWEDSRLPRGVSDAIAAFLDKDRSEVQSIIADAVSVMEEKDLDVDFLRRIGAPLLAPGEIIKFVKECAREFRSVETGSRALDLWDATSVTDGPTRRDLILEVFLPFAEKNGSSFDAAMKRVGLCDPPPHGTAERLRSRLPVAAAKGGKKKQEARAKKAARALIDMGLEKEPKKGLSGLVSRFLSG
jgi:hypothetical protein